MPWPVTPPLRPLRPVTDAITSTLPPAKAAAVRFAEPTVHVTSCRCSTATILACSPDGRAPAPGPAPSRSAPPSSGSPWASSDRTSTSFHSARASSGSFSSSSCRLTSVRSPALSRRTASSPVRLTNGATASVRLPLNGGRQGPTAARQAERVELDPGTEAVRRGKLASRRLIGQRLHAPRDVRGDRTRSQARQRREEVAQRPARTDASPVARPTLRSPGRRPRKGRRSGSATGPRPAQVLRLLVLGLEPRRPHLGVECAAVGARTACTLDRIA